MELQKKSKYQAIAMKIEDNSATQTNEVI